MSKSYSMLLNTLFFLLTVLCLISFRGQAQSNTRYFDMGLEVQQYPTGFLLGARIELGIAAHQSLNFRVGYNKLDHKDFGVHESEIGGGPGFTLGYQYYFKPDNIGFFLGARTDFWFNSVDWKDNIGAVNEIANNTKITVFQPTGIAGYLFLLNEHWVFTPTLALGYEVNIKTEGEQVGEGAIFLWGLNVAYRL